MALLLAGCTELVVDTDAEAGMDGGPTVIDAGPPIPPDADPPDAGPADAGFDCAGVTDGTPCGPLQICVAGSCEEGRCDADGDGYDAPHCGGDDCADHDPDRYPGNTEICDALDHDEDCDPTTYGHRDVDADGHADAACCSVAYDGTRFCGGDCDDTQSDVYPGLVEACDERDNDCDGATDEGVLRTYYPDGDMDGYGWADGPVHMACAAPAGHVENSLDCDDTTNTVSPVATEVCNGVDDDCDGSTDEGCACSVGPPVETSDCENQMGACAGSTQTCVAGTWGPCSEAPLTETCNGIDDDCNGAVDDIATLGDGCGTSTGTCRPGTIACGSGAEVCGGPGYVGPLAAESTCDHLDQDCDARIDEDRRAGPCTYDLISGPPPWCSSSPCSVDDAEAYVIASGDGVPGAHTIRGVFLGGHAVDMGHTTTARATIQLGKCGGIWCLNTSGLVALAISTGREAGSAMRHGMPTGTGYALVGRIESSRTPRAQLYRLTATGAVQVHPGAAVPTDCYLPVEPASTTFTFSLSIVDGVITGQVSGGCGGDLEVTYTDGTWPSFGYGDTATYPRHYTGVTALSGLAPAVPGLNARVTTLSHSRSAAVDAVRGHCVQCP